ncbi:MAG: tRNA (N6-threonylcarbamoyladenosine(37)-N6)-methyltransferase TrmO [Oligoflexia bacterium]|nr:tRNA (N6-threonylcarbamoyladenosine(37)-N6)-methyltransferase TrmO [Oligoflexia bacterium]
MSGTGKKTGGAAHFEFEAIGVVRSCFQEKFGIPRQPGLVSGALGTVKLKDDPDLKTAIRGIEGFSHLWIVFVFHEHGSRKWKPSIRPPRLGGARKVGVLASRSPHRPNPIGLSAVALVACRPDAPGGPELDVQGVDILDGTPVLDIKPYIPYADAIPEARSGWADEPIERTPVGFSPDAEEDLRTRAARGDLGPDGETRLRALIVEMLGLDPRPAFQKCRFPPASAEAQGRRYGFLLLDLDVKWEIRQGSFWVLRLDSGRT